MQLFRHSAHEVELQVYEERFTDLVTHMDNRTATEDEVQALPQSMRITFLA